MSTNVFLVFLLISWLFFFLYIWLFWLDIPGYPPNVKRYELLVLGLKRLRRGKTMTLCDGHAKLLFEIGKIQMAVVDAKKCELCKKSS